MAGHGGVHQNVFARPSAERAAGGQVFNLNPGKGSLSVLTSA